MVKDKTLLEKLAALEHTQWSTWAMSLIDSEPTLSKERQERWAKFFVPYEDLDEETKEFDREWARRVLEIINNA